MKNIFIFFWEIVKIVFIALIIVIPVRYFLFQPFVVNGQSMEPNFAHGDYLIVDEISYRFRSPERGEVIVFHYPSNPSLRHIKRVIGLPGETIKIDEYGIEIFFEEESIILDESSFLDYSGSLSKELEVSLGKDEFFVMGDNRAVSFDSRGWGPLSENYIIGRALIRAFPFNRAEMIEIPVF